MTRRVNIEDWQRLRSRVRPVHLDIFTRDSRLGPRPRDDQLIPPQTLPCHRPRTEEQWQAVTDGVRALLAQRVSAGRWIWNDRRHLTIDDPEAR